MKRYLASALLAAACVAAPQAALAHSDVRVGIHLGIPLFAPPPPRVIYYDPYPVYYGRHPSYYYPAPRVVYRHHHHYHHHRHHHRGHPRHHWRDD